MAGRRRSIWIDDRLWSLIVKAAAQETIDTGKPMSASEWIRRTAEEKMAEPENDR